MGQRFEWDGKCECVRERGALYVSVHEGAKGFDCSLLKLTEYVCCCVLQCVEVCCSVLQCVAVCCSVLQCVALCYSVLQCAAMCCRMLQCAHVLCVYVCVCMCVYMCVSMCGYVFQSVNE